MKIKKFNDFEVNESIVNEEIYPNNFGVVNVHIDGEGWIKGASVDYIRKALSNLQGERHLFVDGKEVNPYR